MLKAMKTKVKCLTFVIDLDVSLDEMVTKAIRDFNNLPQKKQAKILKWIRSHPKHS